MFIMFFILSYLGVVMKPTDEMRINSTLLRAISDNIERERSQNRLYFFNIFTCIRLQRYENKCIELETLMNNDEDNLLEVIGVFKKLQQDMQSKNQSITGIGVFLISLAFILATLLNPVFAFLVVAIFFVGVYTWIMSIIDLDSKEKANYEGVYTQEIINSWENMIKGSQTPETLSEQNNIRISNKRNPIQPNLPMESNQHGIEMTARSAVLTGRS